MVAPEDVEHGQRGVGRAGARAPLRGRTVLSRFGTVVALATGVLTVLTLALALTALPDDVPYHRVRRQRHHRRDPRAGRRSEHRRGRHFVPADARPARDGVRGRPRSRAGRARRALARGLRIAVFTADLFATGNDADNRAAVAKVARTDLDLVGIAVHGPRNAVDKIVKGARMHP